jgi:hypothetical protein
MRARFPAQPWGTKLCARRQKLKSLTEFINYCNVPVDEEVGKSVQVSVRLHGDEGITDDLEANAQPQWVVAHEKF